MGTGSNLLQYLSGITQVVVRIAKIHLMTHHRDLQLIMEPTRKTENYFKMLHIQLKKKV